MTRIAGGFVRTAAFDFPAAMTSSPIPTRVSEIPWEGCERSLPVAREHGLREAALWLFISIHGAYVSFTRHRHNEPSSPMGAAMQSCLTEMKRSLGIAWLLLLVVAAVYLGRWLYGRKTAG